MKEMSELLKVLMHRDGLTLEDAREIRNEMRERITDGEDPEAVLADEGLEPDYIYDVM